MNIEDEMIEIESKKIHERIRLEKSYINYHKIVDRNLPYKFAYLDEWLLKKSKLLMNETKLYTKNEKGYCIKEQRLKTYKRGTIVKVDFGVGIGSEMSQVHFAIVLNNYDNPKNNVLTVLPLTSKQSKFNLYLGTIVIDMLVKRLQTQLDSIKQSNLDDIIKLNKIKSLISYYQSNIKGTFACCSLVTTVSKERIFLPVNEYDIIGRARCSTIIMNKIDEELKNRILNAI